MPFIFPEDIANGQVSDPAIVQQWIDEIYESFPLVATQISSGYASSIIWNVPLPWEALRGSFLGREGRSQPFAPPNLDRLSGDVLYSNALKLAWSRRYASSVFPSDSRRDVGFISAGDYGNRKCVVIPDGFNDAVRIVSVEGGAENDKIEEYQELLFQTNVRPLHAVFDRGVGDRGSHGSYTGILVLTEDGNDNSKASFWISIPGEATNRVFEIDDARDFEKMLEFVRFVWIYGRHSSNGSGRSTLWRFRYARGGASPQDPGPEDDLSDELTSAQVLFEMITGRDASASLATSTDLIQDFCLGHSTSDLIPPSEPTVFLLVQNAAGTTHTVYRIRGIFDDESSINTVAIESPTGVAGDDADCILMHGTSLAVIGHDGTTLKWALYPLECFNATSADAILTGSFVTGTTPLRGSACSDGKFIFVMLASGGVARINTHSNSCVVSFPHQGFDSATVGFKSNICFDGRRLYAHASNPSADGESAAFMPL